VHHVRILVIALALSVVGLATDLPRNAAAAEAADRPDIVVIYMDDFSPLATWLWSDPDRTPALARFVDEGLWLENANGSTPLCCPARVNVYTGLYSHNSGVYRNDMGPYDPGDTVAVKLQDAGYVTIFAGKFLHLFRRYTPTPDSVLPYAMGWTTFDAIWEDQGKFHDYRLWTRGGTSYHGRSARDHSTRVVTQRISRQIRNAPADEPLFVFASLFNGHTPHTPLRRFKDHPKCRDVRPWRGPAYDERDVSDKPAYVRSRPRLKRARFSLTERCEEAMSVDWAVARIRAALEETGRLENTLLVFTADNGFLYGDHRIVGKSVPYSTPVPMYALWPRRWGSEPRVISEPVSNVDLAPTFCAIAGCTVDDADGLDLMPLLDGTTDRLGRQFIYQERLAYSEGFPRFINIRTTRAFDAETFWDYTEYSTGERELYDLTADPHQLQNLAQLPVHAGRVSELHQLLQQGVVEPDDVRFDRYAQGPGSLEPLASPLPVSP
jgi:arylsulfatase A-like enzyme